MDEIEVEAPIETPEVVTDVEAETVEESEASVEEVAE